MDTDSQGLKLSRRSSLFAAAGFALAAAPVAARRTQAQTDYSSHPMVGVWLVRTADGAVQPSIFSADGTFIASTVDFMKTADGTINSLTPQNGIWMPDPDVPNGVIFRSVQSMFDPQGTFIGTGVVDGYPVVSEDGLTMADDWSRSTLTLRDVNNEVLQVLGNDGSIPAIQGVRMTLGELEFPGPAVPAATPVS